MPVEIERYNVQGRKRLIERVSNAIADSGGTILSFPNPSTAPFDFTIRTTEGKVWKLVCYIFLANKYRQAGRPDDEHRFQIKYGSDFQRYHSIFIDPTADKLTLMFAVHDELDLFIAVDPNMHNPTWFSKSIELKEAELKRALKAGWHCWERERSPGRRKEKMPHENFQTESLLAFSPKHILRYIEFESVAGGLETGLRVKAARNLSNREYGASGAHPLEIAYNMSKAAIFDLIASERYLNVAMRGSVAEFHLAAHLPKIRGITDVVRLREVGQPDLQFRFAGKTITVECKNVRSVLRKGDPQVDFQRTRNSKGDPCSRFYSFDSFDILAACLYPVTEKWDFQFCFTKDLPPHDRCPGKIDHKVSLKGTHWSNDLRALLSS